MLEIHVRAHVRKSLVEQALGFVVVIPEGSNVKLHACFDRISERSELLVVVAINSFLHVRLLREVGFHLCCKR